MDPVTKASVSYRFDNVLVDGNRLRIEKDGQPHKITPRAFDVLVYLVEHRDHIVEKQELFDEVWKEKFVTDNALTRTIKEIRQVIGDDADAPRYIETVPKRGYRFIAEVRNIEARTVPETESAAPEEPVAAQIGSQTAFKAEEPVSQAKTGAVKAGSTLRTTKLFGAVIVGTGVIAALIIWKIQISPDQTQTTGVLRNMQVTTWPGLDVYPTLAPDGNSIAYSSDHNGSFEIYVRPLTPGANEIQITSDGQQNFQPAWSPDGKLIAYYSKKRGGIWEVPASGGTAKQLAEFGSRPAWSPDGSLLAFQSYGLTDLSATSVGAISPSTLWIVPTRGGDPRPVTQIGNPPGGHGAPSWSPDGSRIVFIASDGNLSTMWTVSVKENELKHITGSRNLVYDPIYSPDGEHIYYGGVSEPGSFLLYKLRVSRSSGEAVGEPVEIANTGLMRIKNLTISADGKRIAYSAPMMMGGILSIPLSPGSSEATGAPVSLTQGTNYRKGLPTFSPDGRRIAYTDFRGGSNQDVWVMDADGKNPLQLTTDPAIDWAPSWFPDNDRIAFQSNRQGRQAFWSISTKSGKETLLVDPGLAIGFPMLSPDGKQIAFNSTKSGTINIWVVPVEGGEPRQLTFDSEQAGWPCMSPDGRFIGFQMKRGENTHIMVMPADGGTPMQLTFDQGQSWPHNWSPDGDKIVFAGQRNDVWNVFWVSRATKERKQMTTNSKLNAYVRYPAWSPLGNQIAYEYSESIGNIWLLELK
jgi:Tol biopolymer transport system component/DNA-binding winged helix-turn-helix (wHTH) protein